MTVAWRLPRLLLYRADEVARGEGVLKDTGTSLHVYDAEVGCGMTVVCRVGGGICLVWLCLG